VCFFTRRAFQGPHDNLLQLLMVARQIRVRDWKSAEIFSPHPQRHAYAEAFVIKPFGEGPTHADRARQGWLHTRCANGRLYLFL
jgi:hypothetical protein